MCRRSSVSRWLRVCSDALEAIRQPARVSCMSSIRRLMRVNIGMGRSVRCSKRVIGGVGTRRTIRGYVWSHGYVNVDSCCVLATCC